MMVPPRASPRPVSPLDALIRQRIAGRFGLFLVSGEGTFFANGQERKSGYVVDDRGQAYWFWTDWDPVRRVVTFGEWEAIDDELEWHGLGEYQRARARAGLAPNAETMGTGRTAHPDSLTDGRKLSGKIQVWTRLRWIARLPAAAVAGSMLAALADKLWSLFR